jgi:5'-3' exonuclease
MHELRLYFVLLQQYVILFLILLLLLVFIYILYDKKLITLKHILLYITFKIYNNIMGVKQLNSYLKKHSKNGLKKINLYELKNKSIAIDASIYIYKYLTTNSLYESIFNMCFRFRQFKINAVFIFDGKPPKEKEAELKKRSEDKKLAEKKFNETEEAYNSLVVQIENTDNLTEKKELEEQQNKLQEKMTDLKKKFVRINDEVIHNVKLLIMACGLTYIESPCEADVLCAHLVRSNKVYAVMSEDMDMFVYGCHRVLRYFSIIYNNCILYSRDEILKDLDISIDNFKQICVYSGTDYSRNNYSFYENMKCYQKNKDIIKQKSYFEFIDTLQSHDSSKNVLQKTIEKSNMNELRYIYNMFDISKYNFGSIDNIKIKNSLYNKENIKTILRKDKFIFVE